MRRCRLGKPHLYEIKIHKAGFGDLVQPATKRHSSEPKQQADNGSYRQTRWPRLTAKWSVGHFGDETIHLRLVPESKGFSLASLRGPIAITGTFKTPVLRPELGGAIVRGGLAVALGVVSSGLGALIPLLDFGTEQESNCNALLDAATADSGVKTSDMAPRRGTKQNHQATREKH